MAWGSDWTTQQAVDKAVEYLTAKPDFELTVRYVHTEHRPVKGVKVGDLLVHESLDAWGEWQVTHIPTLVSFHKAVPKGKWTMQQLVDWCMKVQADCRDDWEALSNLSYENYVDVPDRIQYAKDRILKHCLGIAV